VETIWQDLRYALRTLRKSPGFTAIAVLALGLGIGANAAVFSVVNAVLLRPLPYKNPDKLVIVESGAYDTVAPANYLDWKKQSTVFESMGAAEFWTPDLTGRDKPEQLYALHLTPDIFPMLGVAPQLGRTLLPEKDQPGKEHVAVIGYGLWQRRFAGDSGVLGQKIVLDGESYTIVGVMPREFRFAPFWATRAEIWAPLVLAPRTADRNGASLRVFARLRPGIDVAQGRAEMSTLTERLEKAYPGTNKGYTLTPLMEKVVGDVRPALTMLLGAVGFVLLIACANVAHMLLARAAGRQKEIAIRAALGAGRSRLIRQLLTESLLLSLAGGALGLLLSGWGIQVLLALSPGNLPRIEQIGLDRHALVFVLGISLFSSVFFGLAPALQGSRFDLNEGLRESSRGSTEGIRRNRFRSLLIVSEFALALVLLVGAGLAIRSFLRLQSVDPGFRPNNLLTMVVSVTGSAESQPGHRANFYQNLLRDVRSLPGVESASAINHAPLIGDTWGFPYSIEGRPATRPGEGLSATYRVSLPGYFQTMGIPLERGRDFTEQDNLSAPGAIIINDRLARTYFPGADPIGKRITLDDLDKNPAWLTIVGVVKDVKQGDWAAQAKPEIYLPYLQSHTYLENPSSHFAYLTLVVRTAGSPSSLASAIDDRVWAYDKNLPISQVETMEQAVAESVAQPRFYLVMLTVFAGTALLLAAVGIYGVMSYSVARRTHEIGIRMALGARPADVLRLVVGQALALAVAGVSIGLAASLVLTRELASILYGVRATDPLTFIVVAMILTMVAVLASFLPARRAMKVDPLVALRYE
jgi:putative ABC transport system permease protein